MLEKNKKLLAALPPQDPVYYNTHFSISSGYEWGRGMPEEMTKRFFTEMQTLFTRAGWSINEPASGMRCPTVGKGGSALYCHPMELSGPCEKALYPEVVQLLTQAETCVFRDVFTFDQIYALTEQEYTNALDQVKEDIELDLMTEFSTDRRDLYHTGYYSSVERVADRYRVPTLERHIGICSDDIHMRYITAAFQDLVREGKILTKNHPNRGMMYRSATGSELLELLKSQAQSLDSKIENSKARSQKSRAGQGGGNSKKSEEFEHE